MSDVSARLSLIVAVQEHVDGPFPAVHTYPASYERRVGGAGVKVFAASGTVGASPSVHDVSETLQTVHYWAVENLSPPDTAGTGNVVVAGGPVNGTLPRGQVIFATNEVVGWAAGEVTVSGTAGTPYKIIAIGV